jgi:transposase InsO family protein
MGSGQCNVKAYNRHLCTLIASGKAKPSFLVSHELSLDEAPEAYKHFDDRDAGWTQVAHVKHIRDLGQEFVEVIDCCTREIVGWNLSHRCRTEDALVAVEQAVLERLPEGSREENLTLTTDNGTQFTSSRFLETLGRLGITHRRTAYHHPEGNSYIERFHRSLKEEEVWTAEYRSLEEARTGIARWIEEYNHDRPHRGVQNRTPHEAFLAFAAVLNSETLTV